MSELAIVEAFSALTDTRRSAGKRHQQALCFALFTLAVAAGNRGFLAIGDWLKAYHIDLVVVLKRKGCRKISRWLLESKSMSESSPSCPSCQSVSVVKNGRTRHGK
ncbi:MAG: transposase family protein, partial [Cyanobacteria bacterium]|nr:transposase family protein [Cyanobacteriota bacterium]